jgi:hypothetical protein
MFGSFIVAGVFIHVADDSRIHAIRTPLSLKAIRVLTISSQTLSIRLLPQLLLSECGSASSHSGGSGVASGSEGGGEGGDENDSKRRVRVLTWLFKFRG